MSIQDDLAKYPCYLLMHKKLIKIPAPRNWSAEMQIHHFVRQSIRKNSPDFYERVEHLQKLILMPSRINYALETMGEDTFYKQYGIKKDDLVFSRLKWRAGYYDERITNNGNDRR